MKWKSTVVRTINMVRLVWVFGMRSSDNLFINCLKVNAMGTMSIIITLAAIMFQGWASMSRLYTNFIQKNNNRYEPPISAKKYTTDITFNFIFCLSCSPI